MKKVQLINSIVLSLLVNFTASAENIYSSNWKNRFNIFESEIEAANHYRTEIEPVFAKLSVEKTPRTLLPFSDSKYPYIRKMVKEVFDQYQLLFPISLKALPVPQVLILEDKEAGAFVGRTFKDMKTPYVFVIQTGLLKLNLPDDTIYGIIAHELTHLLIQDQTLPNQRYYLLKGANTNRPPFSIQRDESLQKMMEAWASSANDVGPYTGSELQDIPASLSQGINFNFLLNHLIQHHSQNEDCRKSSKTMVSAIHNKVIKMQDSFLEEFVPDPKELSTIKVEVEAFRRHLLSCTVDKQVPFREIFTSLTIGDYDLHIRKLSGLQKERFDRISTKMDQAPNPFQGLLDVTRWMRAEMRGFEKQIDIKDVRTYNKEDQADDFAVKILHMLKRNPRALISFFASVMSEGDTRRCAEFLKKKQVPPFGDIHMPHHGKCYRVYHVARMAQYLAENPKVIPISSHKDVISEK